VLLIAVMIDLHQGMTGEELRDAKPGLGGVAFAQLDAWSALLKGDLRAAVRKQLGTWRLLLGMLQAALKRS
jgi:hypothetical protein